MSCKFLVSILRKLEMIRKDAPWAYEDQQVMTRIRKLEKELCFLHQFCIFLESCEWEWDEEESRSSCIDTYLLQAGFNRCPYEPTLYVQVDPKGRILIVCLYVDDLIFTSSEYSMINDFKEVMEAKFSMTYLGLMQYFLGIEVKQTQSGIFVSQKKYMIDILKRFNMKESNPAVTPCEPGQKLSREGTGAEVNPTLFKQMIGSLLYLTATRPDIMFAVSVASRYMEKPFENHLNYVKRILRYLNGTVDFGIMYGSVRDPQLFGYTDSDYAGDVDDRKSTSSYVFTLGTGVISWSSKKQQIVTLSTTEAEFVAAAQGSCQLIWLRRMLEVLQMPQQAGSIMYCDNISTIKLSKNQLFHNRSKHIDVRYHFLRDLCGEGVIEIVHCRSEEQLADIMTKGLKKDQFKKLRDMLGMKSLSNLT